MYEKEPPQPEEAVTLLMISRGRDARAFERRQRKTEYVSIGIPKSCRGSHPADGGVCISHLQCKTAPLSGAEWRVRPQGSKHQNSPCNSRWRWAWVHINNTVANGPGPPRPPASPVHHVHLGEYFAGMPCPRLRERAEDAQELLR